MAIYLEPTAENLDAVQRRVHRWTQAFRVLTRPMLRLRVSGAEAVPETGPALIVANHTNMFDPFLGIAGAGRPIHWFGTATLQQEGAVARFLRDAGSIPKQRFQQDLLAARLAMRWARVGGVVGVFPEGERSWDGSLQEFVPGIERLVRVLRVPVIALRMENAYQHWPRWSTSPRRGEVALHFERLETGPDLVGRMRQALTVRGHDRPVRSLKPAAGITQLVYACPDCQAESMSETRRSVSCGACGGTWRVDTEHRLTGPSTHTLLECVRSVQDRAHQRWASTRPSEVLRSGPTVLHTPDGDFDGHLVLRPDRLEVQRHGHIAATVPLDKVQHANVEFQRRFEVHTHRGILRADLPVSDSGWRWGWTTRAFLPASHVD